ncbi:Lactonase, 7-bladed beta-propeller-domain-containing protein [Plectosphaerella plurivora]|uniref:Lactonase, 7-bladed beta-propeller-domain-containing protein n=1 Tax=Plectosphaerella plurivora TaxID=936078 RepID=A0A9P9A4N2_9PEZI|nr:Lactonase, 7-bladed beta-propeller-domain-containing protein [Plectosphaerella plurivora]
MATALPTGISLRDCNTTASAVSRLLIGVPNSILIAEFDGSSITVTTNETTPGTAPSWMAFKEPNHIYAANENGDTLSHFTFDAETKALTLKETVNSTAGIVHLNFNQDKTRLIASSYSFSRIDVFDVSTDAPSLLKNAEWTLPRGPHPNQQTAHAHQSALDQSGRFFAVNDIGADTVMIIDSKDDAFTVAGQASTPNPACGPRHGVFVPAEDGTKASLYAVVCEYANTVEVFDVSYDSGVLALTHAQSLSTFGEGAVQPAGSEPFAGAIDMTRDGKHIYVSNRVTGATTDSLVHYAVAAPATGDAGACAAPRLQYVGGVDSFGVRPRMFSLGKDEKYLFSSNQGGESGVVVLQRGAAGELVVPPVATLPNGADGPQFILQIN